MAADAVKNTRELAVPEAGITGVRVKHRFRPLSDNGPCYLASGLEKYLAEHGAEHTRGRPYHPITQANIQRYHYKLKNVVRKQAQKAAEPRAPKSLIRS